MSLKFLNVILRNGDFGDNFLNLNKNLQFFIEKTDIF